MKTASSDLFELINSLTPSEKSYFKKIASALSFGEKTNYIKLFEAIEKQTVYNENDLKQKFHNHAIGKNFAYSKVYLFDLILKAVKSYHFDRNAKHEAINLQQEIEIMFDRGLFSIARKLNFKLEKIASVHGIYPALIESLRWKSILLEGKNKVDANNKKHKISLDILNTIQEYNEAFEYFNMYRDVLRINVQPYHQDDAKYKEMLMQFDLKLRKPPTHDTAPLVNLMYFSAGSIYYAYVGSSEKSFKYDESAVKYFLNHKEYIETNYDQFISTVSNYSINSIHTNKNRTSEFILTYLSQVKSYGKQQEVLKWMNYYSIQSLYCLRFGYFTKAMGKANQAVVVMEKIAQFVSPTMKIVYYYNMTCMYMLSGNFNNAIPHLNKTLETGNKSKVAIYQLNIYCMAVILYYLKRDVRLFSHYAIACIRYFKKYKFADSFQYKFISFLKMNLHAPESVKNIVAFRKDLINQYPEETFFCCFSSLNYMSLLDSFIRSKNYQQTVAEKFRLEKEKISIKDFLK